MKRGTPEHPKMYNLAEQLRIEHTQAVGIMEMLWHFTARFAIQGDIGRWDNRQIAEAVKWKGDPDKLVAALISTRWLDQDPDYRLLIHDWDAHADQSVSKTLKNRKLDFVRPTRNHRVYFVRSAATGCIKIGTTRRRVEDRVSEIQTVSGEPLEVLFDTAGSFSLECRFQEQFEAFRVRGEWFTECPEILEFIEDLQFRNAGKGEILENSRKVKLSGGKSKPKPVPVPVPVPRVSSSSIKRIQPRSTAVENPEVGGAPPPAGVTNGDEKLCDDDDDTNKSPRERLTALIGKSTGVTPDPKLIRYVSDQVELAGGSLSDFIADIKPRLQRLSKPATPGFFHSQARSFQPPPREQPAPKCLCRGSGLIGAEYCACPNGDARRKIDADADKPRDVVGIPQGAS